MDSTTAATSPAAWIARRARWSSGASGVVTWASEPARVLPIFCSAVLTRPVRTPAASRAATAIPAVVVLPSVPVIPMTPSVAAGSAYHQAATVARASWLRSTTSWVAPATSPAGRACSTTSTPAPAPTAAPTNACPSTCDPGTATKQLPGRTRRES